MAISWVWTQKFQKIENVRMVILWVTYATQEVSFHALMFGKIEPKGFTTSGYKVAILPLKVQEIWRIKERSLSWTFCEPAPGRHRIRVILQLFGMSRCAFTLLTVRLSFTVGQQIK